MQHQGGGGGGGLQFRAPSSTEMTAPTRAQMLLGVTAADNSQQQQLQQHQQQQQVVEEASPISSRPPAGNFDELTGDETDLVGGNSGGNRWPRQETLALLQIRSEMDIAFRDATLKGPLWDEISRKLRDLGYTRSAKKCKEKFENVQKYYKRTKEGRAGRQDGKSYRFFSQLEALHGPSIGTSSTISPTPPISTNAPLISIDPMPVSSVQISTILPTPSLQPLQPSPPIMDASHVLQSNLKGNIGINFSSSSSSSGSDESDEDIDEFEFEPEPSNPSGGRKRKRGSEKKSSINDKMMEFFEGLMRQVMQKQEAMQQRFLETIEKREHDRMIREEAWKRQEMSRLAREHELLAQDRVIAASRDATIVGFLQKLTGENIQLPTVAHTVVPTPSPPPPQATSTPQQTPLAAITPQQPPLAAITPQQPPPPPPLQIQQQQQQLHYQHHESSTDQVVRHPINPGALMVVPEQQVPPQDTSGGGGGSSDPTSSRWPKTEVLALIKLRSGLETRYQEAGPKGPLWEDISAGMHQMGYKRNSKRCKEKWENINKYFKKVKESNKSRPEDAKTCPYFHELDALYRRKILGSTSGDGSSGSSFGNQNMPGHHHHHHQQQAENLAGIMASPPPPQTTMANEPENNKVGVTLFGQGSNDAKNVGGHKKPEDIMKEFILLQQQQQQLMLSDYAKLARLTDHKDALDQDEDQQVDDDDDDDDDEDDENMTYEIEYQPKQNAGSSNRGNGAPSFVAMVQ